MKEGWIIRKLGDICTIERGGSPRPISAYITDAPDGINWIKIGDAREGSKYITSTAEKIKPEGMKKSRFVHKGDFILSNSMSFGRPYILGVDGCIHDGWLVIRDDYNTFNKSFLYYYLGSPTIYKEFTKLAVGGVVSNLNSNLVRGVKVVVPPIAEQEIIVAELDCLTGIIEKKKQQLEELDKLAHSIFYDMFGDPITNEKGWDYEHLGSLSTIVRGGSPRPIEKFLGGTIPWIKIGDATEDNSMFITKTKEHIIAEGLKKTRYIPAGSLIFANCGVSLGFARIITFDGCIHDGWLAIQDIDERIDPVFLLRTINFCTKHFRDIAPGGTQPNLNTAIMKSFMQIVPPRPTQAIFVQRIEEIESQKRLISTSIAETEMLFNSRMDYWFN